MARGVGERGGLGFGFGDAGAAARGAWGGVAGDGRGGPVAVLGEVRELVGEQGRVRVGEHGRAHEEAVRVSGGAGATERAGVVRVVDPQWYRAGVEAEVRGQPSDHEPGRGQIPGLPAGTPLPPGGSRG